MVKIYYEGTCCVDCCLYLANGDVPDERPDLEADIAAQWPDTVKYQLVNNGQYDKDGNTIEEEFSTSSCDCCGSSLAGSRHGFAVLVDE